MTEAEDAAGEQVTGRAAAARGMAVRREVLGDEHVDRAVAGTTGDLLARSILSLSHHPIVRAPGAR